ncbi:hypothetical protein A33Q_3044 [Indibacter alkaliphilus LW1]|uniref:Polysaccharide pyruvyl transferase domain-containing protein n=1 Tax=Indibacter alkaliphilus (strain CCUG 57479 / KCTC 22604 / LW1) TaxID=1189612 RepID=S2D8Y5_INDAL|nr:polysaccharide pyruvyl transferase family protein [Indibacter alkaliphilus]EOZ95682.1 hypothetical protein A33Q_3044 [Indibacter alkaliphilus LW1]
MNIELRGVEFVNKGAELMLQAIIQKASNELKEVNFVMEVNSRSPFDKLKSEGILAKTNIQRKGIKWERLLNALPKSLRNSLGFASAIEIDAVIDGSGFAFGDKWGADKAGKRCANFIEKWKKSGKKVILLPQAFGPFSDPILADKMKVILSHADLVFARDRISFQYLKDLKVGEKNLFLAPDFTNLVQGTVLPKYVSFEFDVAIIPNQKMLETESKQDNELYLPFLLQTIQLIQRKNRKPFFLIHESKMDRAIAEKINNQLDSPIPIVHEEDPLVVKGIIGKSKAVVTSRFHGLVSALSQNIPCLATGWSHKYEMLFEDYDYKDGLCQLGEAPEYYEEKIRMILQLDSARAISEKLKVESAKQKAETEKMWAKVFDVLKN